MRSVVTFASAIDPQAALVLLGKVTIVLAGAALLSVLLRRRSAAARHFVWTLALAGIVAVTVLLPFAPTVAVPIPRGLIAADLVPVVPNASDATPGFGLKASEFRVASGRADHGASILPGRVPGYDASPLSLGAVGALAWLVGGLLVLSWYAFGHAGLARLSRRATPVDDREWLSLLADAAARTGVSQAVRLLCSPAVGAPVTWGMRRPVIVLPMDASSWSPERRTVVLFHELSHIARRDYLVQLMSSLACAIYWFHPAIWGAARRLRGESERACDDHVLASGTAAPDYAAHLLSVARGSRALRLRGAVAVGMARRSTLEGRLLAMLDETIARHPLSWRARAVGVSALGMLLLPMAGLQPVAAAAREGRTPMADAHTLSEPPQTGPETGVRGYAATVDSVVERAVAASPGERLTLDLQTGGDIDVRGWDQSRVQVRARLAGNNWSDETVDIGRDRNGVGVTIDRGFRRGNRESSNAVEIRVPRRFDVRVSSAGGEVSIVDVEGSFSGTSGGGGIVLERVHGTSSLSTGGGDIRVVDSELDGTVRTGGGMVRISNVRGNLRGSSGSGPVIYAEGTRGPDGERRTGDIGDVHVDRTNTRVADERAITTRENESRARERELERTRTEEARTRAEEQARDRSREQDRVTTERQRAEEAQARERERTREEEMKVRERERAREEEATVRTREEEARMRDRAREEDMKSREAARGADRGVASTRGDAVDMRERGTLNIRKAGGDVDLASAPYGARIFTGGGRVTVGRASGMVEAGTGGGDLRIGPVAGSVRATTGSGTVEVTLADANGDDQSLDIVSGNGRVIVYLPANFEGRFDVETAYTQSSPRATRIDTDFDLRRETTEEWDDREGSPRRYVRALGRVGQSGGLIRIRTVNGDVEVRKTRR
jgi:beta-lactamase regulating signal transducer with metallopeptidase domain